MIDPDVVWLSRLQFGLTASYHFLFVPLTIGLAVLLAMELKVMPSMRILLISGAIVVLTVAVLVLHIGRSKYPTEDVL